MVTTKQRRQVVTHLLAAFPTSERRACRLVRLSRSRWQYRSRRTDDAPLRTRLKELAAERPRWGYQQLHVLLRREGYLAVRSESQEGASPLSRGRPAITQQIV